MKYIHALSSFRLRGHNVHKGQVMAKTEFRRDDVWKYLIETGRAEEVDSLTPKKKKKEMPEDDGQLSDE